MPIVSTIAIFLFSWSFIYLLDHYLTSWGNTYYKGFVERYDLHISPLQLRLYLTKIEEHSNNLFSSFINDGFKEKYGVGVNLWFGAGVVCGLSCFVGISLYLVYRMCVDLSSLFAIIMSTNHDSVRTYPLVFGDGVEEEMRTVKSYDDVDNAIMYAVSKHREPAQSGITPIIPGVNLPLNQIPLFIFVLIVCGIFHELGHAIAAVYSNVKVNGFGFFMVVVYPGAFTDIDSEQLERANAFTKLWIFCAGIWHNLILATLFALIFFSTPVISAPFYSDSNGILVTEVFEESGLFGGAGLEAGNIIVSINGCKVTNISSYFNCLNLIEKDIYPNGYLIEKEVVYQQTATQVQKIDNEVRCCDEFSNTTLASHLCFMYNKEKPGNGSSSRSPFGKIVNVDPAKEIINKFSCFPAKQVTDLTRCHYDTRNSNTLESLECVKPALFNGTFLIRIELAANLKPVLFIGKLDELRYMIDAYHLTPRLSILPNWPPMFLELVCKYFITFSLALAFVNAVPCFSFDGQFILRTVVEFYFGGKKRRKKEKVIAYILLFFSTVFAFNFISGLIKFVFLHWNF